MQTEPNIVLSRKRSQFGKFSRRLVQLVMELRKIGMRKLRRKVRRHPIHMDIVLGEIVENFGHVLDRLPHVRLALPAPCVIRF